MDTQQQVQQQNQHEDQDAEDELAFDHPQVKPTPQKIIQEINKRVDCIVNGLIHDFKMEFSQNTNICCEGKTHWSIKFKYGDTLRTVYKIEPNNVLWQKAVRKFVEYLDSCELLVDTWSQHELVSITLDPTKFECQ